MDCQYIQCVHTEIEELRGQYINGLPYAIELHVEWLAKEGVPFLIKHGDRVFGYFILRLDENDEICLLEFYLLPNYVPLCHTIFDDIIEKQSVQTVMVQSFDAMALKCCLSAQYSHDIIGLSFRDFVETKFENSDRLTKRIASIKDYDLLLPYRDGLYESENELRFMLKNQFIHLYYLENALAGCGYLIQIRPDKNWHDIGMWVNTPYRRQGIATEIIAELKQLCLLCGYAPTCGCAADNIASQKTLEKNGFVSKHALLRFTVKSQSSS